MLTFSSHYSGKLTTETMFVKNVNDDADHMEEVPEFLAQIKPLESYLTVPIRPPAENREIITI